MGERQKAFQTRARKVKHDGDDFEDFVFECFRIAKEERGFTKRLARGRDGAIDLLDSSGESGATTVAECKYIGSGKAVDATARWREVYNNLKANLPSLAANPSKGINSPYRLWLNSNRPIRRYRFCVTASMNEGEIKGLEARIVADFARLVEAGVWQMRDLSEEVGAVRVLPWDWFHAELDEHPSLSFRWFRGLPLGVELFAEQGDSGKTFREFMSGGQLRYFSRDEYARGGIGRVDRGEAELIKQITAVDPVSLLITGPGGVGKTRLSWELSEELSKPAHGFDAYRIGRSAGFDSVAQLVAHYPDSSSILFLVDYAEAVPALAAIADAIEHVSINSGHRLRLLATCRASAVNQVKDAVSVLRFEEKSLGSVRTGESSYALWVTRSILELEPIPEPAAIQNVCRGVPALAAFAIFLFRQHRLQFNTQFGALHGINDFEKWANHRVAALTARSGGDASIARTLARIALALPFTAEVAETISTESTLNQSLLRALLDDCWIEREGSSYFAAHDVFADALLARWVLEADHAATERAIDLLCDAARQNRLAGALIALDRLALHPKLIEIDGLALFNELMSRDPEQTLACCGILLSGALLSFDEKLIFLSGSQRVIDKLSEPEFDVALSFLAAEAVRQKYDEIKSPGISTLIELLDEASKHTHISNMVLRRAYALDPARFRLRALADVRAFPHAAPTHFMLVQLLRSGEPPDHLHDDVRLWLDSNATTPSASFVYSAWLNANGAASAVSESMLLWIDTYGQTFEAGFVYAAWINSNGSLDVISKSLTAWIETFGHVYDARFLYWSLLRLNESIEGVLERILEWIGAYGQMPEASFIYVAWLNANCSIDAVSVPLLSWVGIFGETPSARFVYTAWLEANGSFSALSEKLLSWIELHGQGRGAQDVYAALLGSDNDASAVSTSSISWLAAHGHIFEAQFLYVAWLNAKRPLDTIFDMMFGWVMEHGSKREASNIYRAWFNNGERSDAIRRHVFDWIVQWHDEPGAVYVTRHLCKRHDLPENVILAIARWSVNFAEHEDSIDRLATLLPHAHEDTLSVSGFFQLISMTEDVILSRLSMNCLSDIDRSRTWAILASLSNGTLFGANPYGCVRTIAAVIRSGTVFSSELKDNGASFLNHTYDRILTAALVALQWGHLSVSVDAEALNKFVEWLRDADTQISGWGRLLPFSGVPDRRG